MVAVLITGISGVGKSTALAGLAARGFETVDTDDAGWTVVTDGERLWREDRIRVLLERRRSVPLFVGGTVANQGRFRNRFDAVVLLTAPLAVILERLRTRTTNPFGRTDEERAAVIRDHADIEPLLRERATHVVDGTAPAAEVLARLAALVSP